LQADAGEAEKRLRDQVIISSAQGDSKGLHAAMDAASQLINALPNCDELRSIQAACKEGTALLSILEERKGRPPTPLAPAQAPAMETLAPTAADPAIDARAQVEHACAAAGLDPSVLQTVIESVEGQEKKEFEEMFFQPVHIKFMELQNRMEGFDEAVGQAAKVSPLLQRHLKTLGEIDDTVLLNAGLDVLQISEVTSMITEPRPDFQAWLFHLTLTPTLTLTLNPTFTLTPTCLEDLTRRFGKGASDEAKRAYDEMQEYNASGNYAVTKAWNKQLNKAMDPRDVLELLTQHMTNQQKKIVELQKKVGKKK
jgi:hypothetical protein